MKRPITMKREQLVRELQAIDYRLKMKNTAWEGAIKMAFSNSGSFDFTNLVYNDMPLAEELISKFKLIR